MIRIASLATFCCGLSLVAFAQETEPELPSVLILGDSISIGYTPLVRELLAGEARVVRPMKNEKAAENCAHTAYGLERLDAWNGRMGQRIQVVGRGPTPLGPFEYQGEPAIGDFDTEDASLWFDEERERYYAIFHAHTHLGLITSIDGVYWTRAAHPVVTLKAIALVGGELLRPDRLERPSLYRDPETGEPRALCCAVKIGDDSFNIQIPLEAER